ncbi:MAG: phenylalanine--tRNA ligase beta subunit-related protein [Candidatus Atabeyarchaeum deiterrae]
MKIAILKVAVRKVEDRNEKLEELRKSLAEEVRSEYSLDTVKDARSFRAYRDFFWRLDIDPTKIRPASEALIRRILQTGTIPTINTAVDVVNIVSIETETVIDAFDANKMAKHAEIRFASEGERFLGIGMAHDLALAGGEIVIADNRGPTALYPHRDAERTKITPKTSEILTVACGVPGINTEELVNAEREVSRMMIQFCAGEQIGEIVVLPT